MDNLVDENPSISFFFENIYSIVLGILIIAVFVWQYFYGNLPKLIQETQEKFNEITSKAWLSTNMQGDAISVVVPSLDI
jgi:hypothetical protein